MAQILKPQKYSSSTSEQSMTLGGAPLSFRLNTDSLISRIWIQIRMTVSTGSGTETADGIKAILSNILLRGTLAGQAYNPIPGITSASLIDLMQWVNGTTTIIPSVSGTGNAVLNIPIDFIQRAFPGYLRWATCVPAYLMGGDLNLTITPAAATDIGSTFACSAITVKVIQEQYEAETIPVMQNGAPAIPYLRMELADQLAVASTDFITGRTTFRLPAGGLYAYLQFRSYASASAKQVFTTAPASSCPFDTSVGKSVILYDLNRRVKQDLDVMTLFNDLNAQLSEAPIAGNYGYTFAWDGPNGMFATDKIASSESNVIVEADTRATAGSSIRIVRYRIYDPANALGVA